MGSMDILKNAEQFGFSVMNSACCGLGRYSAWIMCLPAGMACRNALHHLWWDQFHPTSAVNEILSENVWSGLHTSMCYPMNMKDMIGQRPIEDLIYGLNYAPAGPGIICSSASRLGLHILMICTLFLVAFLIIWFWVWMPSDYDSEENDPTYIPGTDFDSEEDDPTYIPPSDDSDSEEDDPTYVPPSNDSGTDSDSGFWL